MEFHFWVTVEALVSGHPWRQAYSRWSLMGSSTNSNLTDGGTNQDFG